MNELITYSAPVYDALNNNEPVVALETTLISQGMPFPDNLELCKEIQKLTAELAVKPAFIALKGGKIKIGLNDKELEYFARAKNVLKVSRQNFTQVLASSRSGATTVSATMLAAHMAGIEVFATGGIGGVHRNAATSFDISADLTEMTRTALIIVSSGAKAILDLPATLEFLETWGVPVLGYKTDFFPAFYSSSTDLRINRINELKQVKEIYYLNVSNGLNSAIILANPIPIQDEIPLAKIEPLISEAIEMSIKLKITGKELTPFLLSYLVKKTGGKTLTANKKLILNNVKLACELAQEMKR